MYYHAMHFEDLNRIQNILFGYYLLHVIIVTELRNCSHVHSPFAGLNARYFSLILISSVFVLMLYFSGNVSQDYVLNVLNVLHAPCQNVPC